MKRYTYILIALLLLCQLSFPQSVSDGFRSRLVASLSPPWRFFLGAKELLLKLTLVWPSGGYFVSPKLKQEIEILRLENHNLHQQLEILKAQVELEKLISEEAELLKQFTKDDVYAKRRKGEIFRLIDLYTQAMTGQVIFRETASWSSSFWINLGATTNAALGKVVIAKNSPVVLGTSILGIVEYVGEHRSRVRLITDSTLAPAVRVFRGKEQKKVVLHKAQKLLEMLEVTAETPQLDQIKNNLKALTQTLDLGSENFYLAKGELHGVRHALWRSKQTLLRGVGFNYDFEDEEGPSRDLRSGKPERGGGNALALVKVGDLLVTTGMDGVFPAGLHVGYVRQVYPLQEGASAYEIDAEPLIENLNEVSFVTVLPPVDIVE